MWFSWEKEEVKINHGVHTESVLEMLSEIDNHTRLFWFCKWCIVNFVGMSWIRWIMHKSKRDKRFVRRQRKKGKGWLPTLLKSQNTFYKQFKSMASFSSLCWVEDDVLGHVKNFWYMSFPFLSQGQMHVLCTHSDPHAP